MRTCHLFAGVGGGLLADLILGHTPIVAVEWDAYACQVLRERAAEGWFPELSVWEGDVRLFDPSEYAGIVDCIHAGFPCQDISVAGNQAGVGHETRSGLYREVLRIAGIVRPRYLFLENVSAILGNGLGTVLADLAAMGFDAEWGCIRASDVGALHHRDRWFCLCSNSDNQRLQGSKGDCGKRAQGESDRHITEFCEDVAHPISARQQGQGGGWKYGDKAQGREGQAVDALNGGIGGFWEVEPGLGRVANGVPHRVHRLKGLGNAQVPIQAAVAWKLLGGE